MAGRRRSGGSVCGVGAPWDFVTLIEPAHRAAASCPPERMGRADPLRWAGLRQVRAGCYRNPNQRSGGRRDHARSVPCADGWLQHSEVQPLQGIQHQSSVPVNGAHRFSATSLRPTVRHHLPHFLTGASLLRSQRCSWICGEGGLSLTGVSRRERRDAEEKRKSMVSPFPLCVSASLRNTRSEKRLCLTRSQRS